MSFNQIDRLSKFGSRTLISAVILGGLLSACSPSGTETPPRLPTLSVIPSNYPTISPTSAMSRVPTVESRTTGSVIRAMTQQELIDVMNSKIENSKDKIGIIIPLKEPVPVASLTLVGACVGGGCLPVETVAGSGLINAVAMTVGTAAEIGYAAVPIMGYLAPISMVLGNSVQGAMEGHYELNPTSGQFEQVNSLQGQYNRAKAVIEFFRGGVKFQGKEIARVGTGVQTDVRNVTLALADEKELTEAEVKELSDLRLQEKIDKGNVRRMLFVEDHPVLQREFPNFVSRIIGDQLKTVAVDNCQFVPGALDEIRRDPDFQLAIFDGEINDSMSGLECIKHARSLFNQYGKNPVIVYQPGMLSLEDENMAYAYGANIVVNKQLAMRSLENEFSKFFSGLK